MPLRLSLLLIIPSLLLMGCPKKVEVKKPVKQVVVKSPGELTAECGQIVEENNTSKFAAAEQLCNKALSRDPNQKKAHLHLASMFEKKEDYGKAVDAYEKYRQLDPNDVKVQLKLANAYLKANKTKKAIDIFQEFQKADPDNISVMNTLVTLYRKNKQFPKAEKLARAILARDGKNVAVYRNLILLYYDWERYNQAILVATLALQGLKAKDAGIYNNLGMVYLKKKDDTKASANFKAALKLDKGNSQAHMNLGTIAIRRGAWRQALDHFQAVLKKEPNNLYANRNYGVALMGTRRLMEAKTIYEKVLSLRDNDAESIFQLGVIHFTAPELRKKQKESQKFFDQFLANPDAKKLKSYARATKFIKQAKQRLKVLAAMAGTNQPKPRPKPKKRAAKPASLDNIPDDGKKDEDSKDGTKKDGAKKDSTKAGDAKKDGAKDGDAKKDGAKAPADRRTAPPARR